jgi:hypothetical protein
MCQCFDTDVSKNAAYRCDVSGSESGSSHAGRGRTSRTGRIRGRSLHLPPPTAPRGPGRGGMDHCGPVVATLPGQPRRRTQGRRPAITELLLSVGIAASLCFSISVGSGVGGFASPCISTRANQEERGPHSGVGPACGNDSGTVRPGQEEEQLPPCRKKQEGQRRQERRLLTFVPSLPSDYPDRAVVKGMPLLAANISPRPPSARASPPDNVALALATDFEDPDVTNEENVTNEGNVQRY